MRTRKTVRGKDGTHREDAGGFFIPPLKALCYTATALSQWSGKAKEKPKRRRRADERACERAVQ